MGRTILTEQTVRRMHPPRSGRLEVWDAALPGFGVRVTENGRRSWVLVTRLRGKPIRLTLGAWPATSLAKARELAREAIHAVARGEDPRDRKRAAAGGGPADAFERVAAEFVAKWAKPRNRTWEETQRILDKYVAPEWNGRRLADVARADVVALVDRVAEKHGPIMANRVLAQVKKVFAWALDRGLVDVHPVARLMPPGKETARDRVLADAEVKKLWATWTAMGYPWGTALQVLLLTAARRGEAEAMRWDEVDFAGKLWTVPAERVKVNLPLLVPLSDAAVELLARVPRFDGCPYVFSTRRNRPVQDWSGAVEDATERSGVNGWRVHDLRRTVRTGLSRLGVAADIAERVLGHVIPGVRAVYDRHEYLPEKRAALDRWAAHLAGLQSILIHRAESLAPSPS